MAAENRVETSEPNALSGSMRPRFNLAQSFNPGRIAEIRLLVSSSWRLLSQSLDLPDKVGLSVDPQLCHAGLDLMSHGMNALGANFGNRTKVFSRMDRQRDFSFALCQSEPPHKRLRHIMLPPAP
jgi:hypothetical protein